MLVLSESFIFYSYRRGRGGTRWNEVSITLSVRHVVSTAAQNNMSLLCAQYEQCGRVIIQRIPSPRYRCINQAVRAKISTVLAIRKLSLRNFAHAIFYNETHTLRLARHPNAKSLVRNLPNKIENALTWTQRTQCRPDSQWNQGKWVSLPYALLWYASCEIFLLFLNFFFLYLYSLIQGFPTFFEWRHTWQNFRDSVTPHSRWDPHPHLPLD
jgi:hypothetical protein